MSKLKTLQEMSLEELWELFPIILEEHNSLYADWYREAAESLQELLSAHEIARVNHIGSTSVEGLIAKPIIDILLEFSPAYDISGVRRLLEENGWIVMEENKELQQLDLNKGYTINGFDQKVFHLHIKELGDWNELYFRDYLRENDDVARAYEELKLGLKEKFEHNRDGYTNAKTDFITAHTKEARRQFANRYKLGER